MLSVLVLFLGPGPFFLYGYLGLIHTHPDIFENGDFSLHYRRNTRAHVAYANPVFARPHENANTMEIR